MSGSGKSIAGIILLLLGASVFFGMFGIHLGGIISFVIAVALIWFGAKKLKTGHTVLGLITLVIGFMMVVSSLPFLISVVFAVICIYFGWKLVKRTDDDPDPAPAYSGTTSGYDEDVKVEDNFDSEWKEFLQKFHEEDGTIKNRRNDDGF